MLRDIWSLQGRYRILHLTWFAFFLTFVVWFNLAPLATTVKADLGLSVAQMRALALCNVALTVPARVVVGMLLDKYGPRLTYSALLVFALVPCLLCAAAQDFNHLVVARLLLSIVGAGFVIGIRMMAEWFPPNSIGQAQGIYGGWGNAGSSFAFITMVTLAGWLSFSGGVDVGGVVLNWRGAIAFTGIVAAVYGVIYYCNVTDTPPGSTYHRPPKTSGLEVTSIRDVWGSIGMAVPIATSLLLVVWNLHKVKVLDAGGYQLCLLLVPIWFAYRVWGICRANWELLQGRRVYPKEERYAFRQVAILELTYIVNFGSELAVVSMLPAFCESTFGLPKATAALLAASYPLVNLVGRPAGGYLSDRLGSRKGTLTVLTLVMGLAFLVMGTIRPGSFSGPHGLVLASLLLMVCALPRSASAGATFAMVPLIQRRVTGQIAGLVGAYGSVGSLFYLAIYSQLPTWIGGDAGDPTAAVLADSNSAFFQVLGIASLVVGFLCHFFLSEPRRSAPEVAPSAAPTAVVG